ncbi:hypothetical protein SSX86_021032 [Deinandra increscens subsp. villosa]|uniref:Uncharacterized protein n=1 Tax=Deinandra increscens subsp. villosa TaxID=3103831 RepID=A0AAP0GRC0_9ASTR
MSHHHSASSLSPSAAAVNQDSVIDSLISAEPHHSPPPDYLRRLHRRHVHVTRRQDSVNWILHAHAHFSFRPLTALLAVNYFDRFLSTAAVSFDGDNGWEFQLLSVACFSLAAKMEEPEAPSLSDLQVSEPRFVFEPKTVRRMELWVMEQLNWRLRSVTPFDFLHYFIFNLPQSSSFNHQSFLWVCSDLIVKTLRVIDFLGFRPSVIAAAAVISAAGEGVVIPESYYAKVNKEMVRSCHRLMEEYLVDTCPWGNNGVRKLRRSDEPPASPDGVLDAAACVSCGSCSDDGVLVPATFSGYQDK